MEHSPSPLPLVPVRRKEDGMLISSRSWDISCSMCLLTGGVNSPLPVITVTCEESGGTACRPSPNPLSPVFLQNILSCQAISFPFSMPQIRPRGNTPLMSVPLHMSPGPFSPSQTQSFLSMYSSLCPFISLNAHFIIIFIAAVCTVNANSVGNWTH